MLVAAIALVAIATAGQTCTNTCTNILGMSTASDGECDDGGSGSEFNSCLLGTDCVDCGTRTSSGGGGGGTQSCPANFVPKINGFCPSTRSCGTLAGCCGSCTGAGGYCYAYTFGTTCSDNPISCSANFDPLPTDVTGSRPSSGDCPVWRPYKTTTGCCGACAGADGSVYPYDCGSYCSTTASAASCQTTKFGTVAPSPPPAPELVCFPSEALVTMADGTPRRLDALRAGDAIVAASADGTLTTDTVSILSLADADVQGTTFVVLTTASGRNLTLTPTHHVPIGAACCADLKQAKDIAVGETVYELAMSTSKTILDQPGEAVVSASAAVRSTQVKKIGTATKPGLHSPVLSHGTMPIVNGVVTSFDELHSVRLASYGLPLLEAAGPLLEAAGLTATFRDAFLGAHRKYVA